MQQKELYDVIIVGASIEGIALAEYLLTNKPELKIAIVSRSFKYLAQKAGALNIDELTGEVVLSTYYHGVIGFTLKDRRAVYGKKAVIATGTKPIKPFINDPKLKNSGMVYSPADIINISKNHQVVVAGSSADAVKYSIELAKRFKYVYLCSKEFNLDCDTKLLKKLNDLPNVVHLPGCNIVSYKKDRNGRIQEVTLDTYSTIHCAALVGAFGRLPDISGVSPKMLEVDLDGYAVVTNKNESTKIPGIYVISACARRNTKHMLTVVGDAILGGKE